MPDTPHPPISLMKDRRTSAALCELNAQCITSFFANWWATQSVRLYKSRSFPVNYGRLWWFVDSTDHWIVRIPLVAAGLPSARYVPSNSVLLILLEAQTAKTRRVRSSSCGLRWVKSSTVWSPRKL